MKQKGFSLFEVMIGGALVAVAAVGMAKLFHDQNQAVRYAKHRAEVEVFHAGVAGTLSDFRNCNANFYRHMPGGPNAGTAVSGTLNSLKLCCPDPDNNETCSLKTAQDCIGPGYNFAENSKEMVKSSEKQDVGSYSPSMPENQPAEKRAPVFKFTKAQLTDTSGNAAIFSSGNEVKNAILKVTYEMTGDISGERLVVKKIPLSLKFAASQGFVGCVDAEANSMSTLQREICKALGNMTQFNPASGLCESVSAINCPTGEMMAGIDSSGKEVCGIATSLFNMPDIVNPTDATGCSTFTNMRFVVGMDNKIRTECY